MVKGTVDINLSANSLQNLSIQFQDALFQFQSKILSNSKWLNLQCLKSEAEVRCSDVIVGKDSHPLKKILISVQRNYDQHIFFILRKKITNHSLKSI